MGESGLNELFAKLVARKLAGRGLLDEIGLIVGKVLQFLGRVIALRLLDRDGVFLGALRSIAGGAVRCLGEFACDLTLRARIIRRLAAAFDVAQLVGSRLPIEVDRMRVAATTGIDRHFHHAAAVVELRPGHPVRIFPARLERVRPVAFPP